MSKLDADYRFDPSSFRVTDEMKRKFDDLGYIMLRGLLDKEELNIILNLTSNEEFQKEAFGTQDADGRLPFLTVWNQPGNDVTGMVGRSHKVAGTCEKLLDGEVYHYHSKITMKDPLIGGGFEWHQDYGYWYYNGLLYPDCMTVFIALDPCTVENGCLQIIPGSHKCGRIEQALVEGQTKADPTRVTEIKKISPVEVLVMQPGDAVFFHSNVLHHSERNMSDERRWAMCCCYNRASNNPVKVHHHSNYVPLDIVPDSAIKNCKTPSDFSGKEFMDPNSVIKGQIRFVRRGEHLNQAKVGEF